MAVESDGPERVAWGGIVVVLIRLEIAVRLAGEY
jgi:hypothetical protein